MKRHDLRRGALLALAMLVGTGATGDAASPAPSLEWPATEERWPEPPGLSDSSFVNLATGGVRDLPEELRRMASHDYRPSPDGRSIAFVALEPGSGTSRIVVGAIDGSAWRPISPADVDARDPSWSPDGRRIVFVADDHLAVAHLRSGSVDHIDETHAGRLSLPSFSPDGRTILYTRTVGGGEWLELWRVPARGGRARRLLANAAFGAWSSDGSAIAYRRFRRAVRPGSIWPYDHGIWVADGNGRHLRRLGGGPRCCTMAPFDWSVTRPMWSPDGTRIAYGQGPLHGSVNVLETGTRNVVVAGHGDRPAWLDDRTLVVEDYR